MNSKIISGPGFEDCLRLAENQLVSFTDTDKAWQLKRGSTLMVLTIKGDKTPPRYQRLLEIKAGDVFFFAQPRQTNHSISLFIREECEITCPGLMAELFDDSEHHLAAEQWMSKLKGLVSERCPLSESEYIFSADADKTLEAGMTFSPKLPDRQTSSNWIALKHGEIHLADLKQANIAAHNDIAWLPIDESFWFSILCDAEFSLLTTAQVPIIAKQEGLAWLFDSMATLQEHHIDSTTTLSIGKKKQKSKYAGAAPGSFVSSRSSASLIEQQRTTPLAYALSELGKRSGGEFLYPAQFDENTSLEQQIGSIANRSGTQVRSIHLPDDWRNYDFQDVLAVTRDSQTPIAIVRKPGALPETDYHICSPPFEPQGLINTDVPQQAPVTAISTPHTEAPELESVAYVFTMQLDETTDRKFSRFFSKMLHRHRGDLYRIALLNLMGIGLSIFVPLISGLLMNEIIPDGARDRLLNLAGIFLSITLITFALNYLKSLYLLRVQTLLNWRLQEAVMNRLLQLPVKFVNRYSSGDLQNRLMLISSIATELYTAAITMLMDIFLLLLFLFLCYWFLPDLGWIALSTTLAFCVLASMQVYFSYSPAIELEEREGKIFGFAHQLINGLPKLRLANAEHRAYSQWRDKFAGVVSRKRELLLISDIGEIISPIITYSGSLMVMAAAGALVLNSNEQSNPINLGSYFAFYFAYQGVVSGGKKLISHVSELAVLWFKRSLVIPILNEPLERTESRTELKAATGRIEMKNIAFRYDNGPLVLEDINISVRPGQFVAIVGPSGAGKSTLLRLLLGFEDPTDGSIEYNSQDLSNLDLQSVRSQLGVVMQKSSVPAGTLAEIISGNNPIPIDKIWAAAMVADIANDIDTMPMKMNTVVNHGAPTLSGGQRQRLMIARAVAAKRRIFLFDESTSALDNVSQRVVSQNLSRFQITRIIIAHRLSTIRDADWIYVIENGRISQQGQFTELYETDGLFRQLAQRQSAGK